MINNFVIIFVFRDSKIWIEEWPIMTPFPPYTISIISTLKPSKSFAKNLTIPTFSWLILH